MAGPSSKKAATPAQQLQQSELRKRTKQADDELSAVNGHAAAPALQEDDPAKAPSKLAKRDVNAIILLVVLYMLQGVPVGLAFGTMPFLLKSKLSYAEIGTFALSTYPYSLKLAWSPIVDSCWVPHLQLPFLGRVGLGRRKSWIVPVQLIVGVMLWFLSSNVDQLLLSEHPPINTITALFFTLVLFAATQDIAVDGWALTLLSQDNLSYASTAQTVGLNIGYFMSFTVFLAMNSTEFCNKYLRSASSPLNYPVLSLSAYLRVASLLFVFVTLWLAFFKDENADEAEAEKESSEPSLEDQMGLKGAYDVMWKICKLRHVQSFLIIHLIAKIGFQANEAVTGLKLVEKGFSKEDLALTVLIDFPFQIVLGYFAARWSRGDKALTPWLWGYAARLVFAVVSMGIVAGLSSRDPGSGPIGIGYFLVIIVSTVAGSFASTVQFVGISAFHTQIADPLIGGTYMTLLNTVSNLGGTWPRYFVLKAVDSFTVSECRVATLASPPSEDRRLAPDTVKGAGAAEALLKQLTAQRAEAGKFEGGASASHSLPYTLLPAGASCATSETAKQACLMAGATAASGRKHTERLAASSLSQCITTRDGYFATSTVCVIIGVILLFAVIMPQSRRLERMPVDEWKLAKKLKGEDDEKKKRKAANKAE